MNRSIVSTLLATFVLPASTAITGVMLIYFGDDLTRNGISPSPPGS